MKINGYNASGGIVLKLIGVAIVVIVWWVTFAGKVDLVIETLTKEHGLMAAQHTTSLPVLRQICRNTAKTEYALSVCDGAGD